MTIELPDFAALDRKLGYLGRQGLPAAKSAVVAGARVIARKQQQMAPAQRGAHHDAKGRFVRATTGGMKRSIKSRSIKTGGTKGTIVGAKAGFDVGRRKHEDAGGGGDTGAKGYHGHLYVGGTVQRFTGSVRVRIGRKTVGRRLTGNPVRSTGMGPPHKPSFIRTAADAAMGDVDSKMHEVLVRKLDEAITKLG